MQHSIAHVGLVAPQDLVRFKALNVAADVSPPIWIPGPYSASMAAALGKARNDNFIPVADLVKAGAHVVYGSDWPAIASSFNPWPHLQSMVDRSTGEHQRIDLRTAMNTMTGAAAAHLGLSKRIGSIERGKSADFVILSADPFQVATSAIGTIAPMTTVFEGKEVFRK
ncbi:Amidohydrolase family protein [compost metagenome]